MVPLLEQSQAPNLNPGFSVRKAAITVFENHRKSLIQHCERSELYVYILSGQKLIKKCQKWSNLASFWKPEACGQTELPDRSTLIGQKLVENAKVQKFKCDILGDFQTLCNIFNSPGNCVWISEKSMCSRLVNEFGD